jgi:hypothetical protein
MSTNGADKSLGDVVTEVTEKASLLVREEIELAKAEISEKVTKLGKGAGAMAAAGVLAVFALIFFFHGLAWFFNDLFDWMSTPWAGYFATFALIILGGGIAGFLGYRWLKGGSPPTPDLAIEEAKRTREMLEQSGQHEQLGRGGTV